MKRQLFLLAGLSAALWGMATAQGSATVKLTLDQDLIRTVQKDGKASEERVTAPSSVLPGATLIEEVTARNISGKLLTKLRLGIPVPQGTQFAGSATPTNGRWTTQFTALCAGKALDYAEAPLKCTETVDGKPVTRDIKPPEYTNVRWLLGTLKVDETLKLSFRVKVN